MLLITRFKTNHNNCTHFSGFYESTIKLRHKQPLTSHIEPPIKSCRFVRKHQIFLNCSANNLKKLNIVVALCLNVQMMKSQGSVLL